MTGLALGIHLTCYTITEAAGTLPYQRGLLLTGDLYRVAFLLLACPAN